MSKATQTIIHWGLIGVLVFSTYTFIQLYNIIENDLQYTTIDGVKHLKDIDI